MGEVVYLKDRQPRNEDSQTILTEETERLERVAREMHAVEFEIDQFLEQDKARTQLTPRQVWSTIGIVLMIVAFIAWRILYV